MTTLRRQDTRRIGNDLRKARLGAGLTQETLARRAGIPRQKIIQLEQGKPGVAMATYLAVAEVLDLDMTPRRIEVRIDQYPQLRELAWNRRADDTITERDALALYERNWRYVDEDRMPADERAFLDRLIDQHGGGVLHV